MIRDRSLVLLLGLGLLGGLLFDTLVRGRAAGLSSSLFFAALVALLALAAARWRTVPRWRNLWLVAAGLFFAAMLTLRSAPYLVFLDFLYAGGLIGLWFVFYASGAPEDLSARGYAFSTVEFTGRASVATPRLVRAAVDPAEVQRRAGPSALPVARGLLIALPIVLLFAALLASADLVFAHDLQRIADLGVFAHLASWTGRALVVAFVGWAVAGGLYVAVTRGGGALSGAPMGWPVAPTALPRVIAERLGALEAVIVLAAVDVLFAGFAWIQMRYLFGGATNVGIEGFTYAQYARRGFGELVAVSILTLLLVLGLRWIAPARTPRERRVFNLLATVMAALVFVMLASAFQRLLLYEDAYGYTRLRLFIHTFMVWLGITFVWLLIVLWRWPQRFALGVLLCAIGFLATLNLINPDALVARRNIGRVGEVGQKDERAPLDVAYLGNLSPDAVPVLLDVLETMPPSDRTRLLQRLDAQRARLEEAPGRRPGLWVNLGQYRAYQALVERPTGL